MGIKLSRIPIWNLIKLKIKRLGQLDDVDIPSPSDNDVLYWNNAASKWKAKAIPAVDKRIYTLVSNTCIWREYTNRVSSTARTATVSSVAGDVITLTANEAYRFGDWGASPEYMNAANVYAMIRNSTRAQQAWVKATPAVNQLQVTAAADIATWQNGDTLVTYSLVGANFEELDLSPLLPAGATAVFLSAQVNDNGGVGGGYGTRFSKLGAAGTWNNISSQVDNLVIYGLIVCQLQANRHLIVRDIASGVDTLQHAAFATMYIK